MLCPARLRMVAVTFLIAGFLGTCDTPDVAQGPTDESTTTGQKTETTQNEAEHETVVDVLASHEEFGTFLKALQSVNLDDSLAHYGPYTVFAPTNEAFAALPATTRERLLDAKNTQELADLLTYHVIEGEARTGGLEGGLTLTTLQGGPLAITTRDDDLMVNHARVVTPNLVAQNGVVHAIDTVLRPGSKGPK